MSKWNENLFNFQEVSMEIHMGTEQLFTKTMETINQLSKFSGNVNSFQSKWHN